MQPRSAAMGRPLHVSASSTTGSGLITGRVTVPVSPMDDEEAYQKYVKRCYKTWTIDVVTDDGRYFKGCRIMMPSGNSREGFRRLFRMPRPKKGDIHYVGDAIILGFLHGSAAAPVVMGALNPPRNPAYTFTELEEEFATTRPPEDWKAPEEWQDRHDFLDLAKEDDPVASHTLTRDTAVDRDVEHKTIRWIGEEKLKAHVVSRDREARAVEREHYVELKPDNEEFAVVRSSNTSATDLRTHHEVLRDDLISSVTYEDLAAKVLQLTQLVEGMQKVILRSENGETLLLQQETERLRLTAASSSLDKKVGLIHEDLNAGSRAGFTISEESEFTLRRASKGKPEAFVMFSKDGSVTVRSQGGASVRLTADDLLLTSKKATVTISESQGVCAVSAGGAMVSVRDNAVTVAAPAISLAAGMVHLATGAARIGSSSRGTHGVPSIEILHSKLQRLERDVEGLKKHAKSHKHRAQGPSSPTSAPMSKPSPGSAVLFRNGSAKTDALKTLRGD